MDHRPAGRPGGDPKSSIRRCKHENTRGRWRVADLLEEARENRSSSPSSRALSPSRLRLLNPIRLGHDHLGRSLDGMSPAPIPPKELRPTGTPPRYRQRSLADSCPSSRPPSQPGIDHVLDEKLALICKEPCNALGLLKVQGVLLEHANALKEQVKRVSAERDGYLETSHELAIILARESQQAEGLQEELTAAEGNRLLAEEQIEKCKQLAEEQQEQFASNEPQAIRNTELSRLQAENVALREELRQLRSNSAKYEVLARLRSEMSLQQSLIAKLRDDLAQADADGTLLAMKFNRAEVSSSQDVLDSLDVRVSIGLYG